MKVIFLIVLFGISVNAYADYLVVQRNGNMRAEPSTASEILEKIHTGDTLVLVDANQTNAYYHVKGRQSGQEGWVYRTLVRKVTGDFQETAPTGAVVDIRILDVGAGHCALIKLPGDKYVIFDAGSDKTLDGNRTLAQIKEYIPAGSVIELFVLSHTDADHINGAEQVIRDYQVKKLLWTGYDRSMLGGNRTVALNRLHAIIPQRQQMENINLHERDSSLVPGDHFNIGSARFTFLCGFGEPPADWTGLDDAEKLNGVSIVMKLSFAGNSILFTGDAVGRHRDDEEDALLATESFLVEHAAAHLPSTIVLAPHHGAKNGSSTSFVQHVNPETVIFPAGHEHRHPTKRTAELYLQFTTSDRMFRTDRGDDEGADEWNFGRCTGCRDRYNDDNIQVQLRGNGTYRVYYMTPDGSCN